MRQRYGSKVPSPRPHPPFPGLDRLAKFTATRRVSHVLGCHIEMTTQPDRDYPVGCRYQPVITLTP